MKKVLLLAFIVMTGVFLMISPASAINTGYTGEDSATAGIGITNTVHDLRQANTFLSDTYAGATPDYLNRICIFCHAPHHAYRIAGSSEGTGPIAGSDYTYLPLWNHATTTTTFDPYDNGAGPLQGAKMAQSMDPAIFEAIGAVSLLCLSCHDGTVGVNEYGNDTQDSRSRGSATGAAAFITAGGSGNQYAIGLQGNLKNHHPIGFNYDLVAADDPEIESADAAFFTNNYGSTPVRDHLYVNQGTGLAQNMECATCHAVHNKNNGGEKLLYVSDANSNFCLVCHLKGDVTP